MRIGEVAKETGLTISNIRFYEKKGLLEPQREQESKYRDYTKEDIDRLKLIILYRKMDISVETIEDILCDKISLTDALEQQMKILKEKQQILQSSIDLCEEMIVTGKNDQLSVDYYLNYIKEEEGKGTKFVEINDLLSGYVDSFSLNRIFLPVDLLFPGRLGKVINTVISVIVLLIPFLFVVLTFLEKNIQNQVYMGICTVFIMIICWWPVAIFWWNRRK